MTDRPARAKTIATVFAVLGLVGAAALLGFALVGLLVRRTRFTIGALVAAAAVLIVPPVLLSLL
jgi:hypothetical protein